VPSEPRQPNLHLSAVQPIPLSRGRKALAWLIYAVIQVTNWTLRWRLHDPHRVLERIATQPVIFSTWHNRLALALPAWRRYLLARCPERRVAAIASASRDGTLVAAILQKFGARPVRGSSSRRGLHAMVELLEWAKEGYDLAITPDGPRGPLYSIQPGVVSLAQMSCLPIVPMTYRLSYKITLKSWDRFQIPLPFSRCDLYLGEPISIPRTYRDRERTDALATIRESMLSLTQD